MSEPYASPIRLADARPSVAPPRDHLEESDCSRAVLSLTATTTAARPLTVVLGPATYDVSFHLPLAPTRPFAATATGAWRVGRAALIAHAGPSPATTRAALVTVARDDLARQLLDLTACGSVTLDGPPVAVGATLCDIVVELATRRWCDLREVVVVGFGDDIAAISGIVCLPNLQAALELMRGAPGVPRCIVVAPCSSPGPRRRQEQLGELLDLAHAREDTGVVSCEPAAPARVLWRLVSHQETLDVTLVGQSGRRLLVPAPAVATTSTRPAPPPRPATSSSPAPRVLVRVLGQVDVIGSATPLGHRPRVTELLTYLALHPEGCSGEALAAAVWPRKRVPPQTLANRLSETRRALGLGHDGSPLLHRQHGRHVLSPEVATDLALFKTSADGCDRRGLEDALRLVRGRPLEGLHDSGWTFLEGFVSDAESAVVTAAGTLCEICLEEADPAGGVWAVRRGLLASPWDEGLYRLLMRAHHAAGNKGGIEAALRSLARALEWEGPPLEGVHPDTARLYEALVRRTPERSRGPVTARG